MQCYQGAWTESLNLEVGADMNAKDDREYTAACSLIQGSDSSARISAYNPKP